jgi:uncharacterized protein (TIGR01777 family)
MRILVSGSHGMVGSALLPALAARGHQVSRLVRSSAPAPSEISWDPEAGRMDPAYLSGVEAIIHLAGENIASKRWSEEQKKRIRESRVKGTSLLAETIARLGEAPRIFISSSAIGYYGDRGDETLSEDSPPGSGFLPEVCQAWESATGPAARKGIRVVLLRFGVILSPSGGALKKMLLPFRMGLGGPIGTGRQLMSWITLDDAVGVVLHALDLSALRGPVNAVTARPVSNSEFTRSLGRALHRPAVFPMPAFAARLAFGEMADALLLSSARVEPQRLLASRYPYQDPKLEPALRRLLS